jgi:hypothetical protein
MVYEIKTLEQFRDIKSRLAGYIVIVDKNNQEDDKIHIPSCSYVTEEGFQKKVLANHNKTGNYYYSPTIKEARTKFKARECRKC